MFLGRWDWASSQIGFTGDNEYLIAFKKKKPWNVRWCWSLSSWLKRKSLKTSLLDFYTSYWLLVWQLDDLITVILLIIIIMIITYNKGNYTVFWTTVMVIEPLYSHWDIVAQRLWNLSITVSYYCFLAKAEKQTGKTITNCCLDWAIR